MLLNCEEDQPHLAVLSWMDENAPSSSVVNTPAMRSRLETNQFGSLRFLGSRELVLPHLVAAKESPTSQLLQPETRRVRFDLSQNLVHFPSSVAHLDGELGTWYTVRERRHQKKRMSQEVRNRSSAVCTNFDRVMQRTYDACCNAAVHQHPHEAVPPVDHILTESEQRELLLWLKVCANQAGLEKHLYSKDRFASRRQLVTTVLDLQDQSFATVEGKEDRIREACEQLTAPTRMFYTLLGQAHGNALLRTTRRRTAS